ncbi:MAG: FadR family transcriptional regulator [Anaerolineae bacterium]|nr:FadR family transcriptional regulator [Anaerolineae bacterium]
MLRPFRLDSGILRYIIEHRVQPGERLPTITELSRELGVSVSKVREELEVVRTLGLVQVKPRIGTRVQEFDFEPAVTLSLLYALGLNPAYFYDFSKLRKNVELSFWHEAVAQLTPDDIVDLRELVTRAYKKLNCNPVEVPFQEHRSLHLTFYKRLDNPFVQGVLGAYWIAYEAFGLALYTDLSYHREVWGYHERMVECVAQGDYASGCRALEEHMQLLRHIPAQVDQGAEKTAEQRSLITHIFE